MTARIPADTPSGINWSAEKDICPGPRPGPGGPPLLLRKAPESQSPPASPKPVVINLVTQNSAVASGTLESVCRAAS
ncbi:hypothetical protein [Streptomyces sp. NPDC005423]|uniref:hypothetical protein n=1 Tax=Streptomyces sp. NPDC005423 TaxID=3155343 RepID=UPI0033AEBFC0